MSKERINLIPKKSRAEFKLNNDIFILFIFVLSIGFISTKAIIQHIDLKELKVGVIQLKTNEKKIDKDIEALQPEKNKNLKVNESKFAIKNIIDNKLQWPEIFKELTYIVPEDLWLNQFKAKNDNGQLNLMLKGRAPSHYKTSVFFSSIENSKFFNQALLNYSERISDINPTLYSFNFATPGFLKEEEAAAKKKNNLSSLDIFSQSKNGASAPFDQEAASKALKSVLGDQLRLDVLDK